ncbi:SDR family NAD(P)-dependent oxidoreductase [Acaryochloris marina]|uniref:Oxidoreductase, short-chain dehydrogenase/reductase family protein n=1 Tax=Acaryochloris marina (strain MBIC 11017) TaxID=329726 RepID=B0C5A9_ACAM1|nr:SDR family NAD(P)-dependent oxidoreductase [Acaryochloris marina]ABW26349.1 oxidoreductase, short-chain dehydrogenase/reductase family protein [Acaryochloris marina MBIC11017]BDM81170.1 oxidoreductase [Acaryochloris marina MBIC10699]
MKFDRNSTTTDVLNGIDLSGKTVLVTGASTGLGAETARALAACGADVTLVARSKAKLSNVANEIQSETGRLPEIATLELDKPATIRRFAEDWLSRHEKLDILINNAGIMAPPLTRTAEGWESQFATNHLGHFLLTNLLADATKASGEARVINLSSAGHWYSTVDLEDPNFQNRDYEALQAYGQSKTANIWFTVELARRWADRGVTSFAVHPGGIQTELGRNLEPEVAKTFEKMIKDYPDIWKTVPQGAATSCWATTSPDLSGKTGLYLEDCHISEPGGGDVTDGGYAPHAYDADGAKQLWVLSNDLLGTEF